MNGKSKLFGKMLRNEKGETLVEALVSVLIISAVFLMLSTAIVTAANINAKAARIDSSFDATKAVTVSDIGQYELKVGVGTDSPVGSDDYEVYAQNGYVFYKHSKANLNSDSGKRS